MIKGKLGLRRKKGDGEEGDHDKKDHEGGGGIGGGRRIRRVLKGIKQRPSYKVYDKGGSKSEDSDDDMVNEDEQLEHVEEEEDDYGMRDGIAAGAVGTSMMSLDLGYEDAGGLGQGDYGGISRGMASKMKADNIASSAGTQRLNRIMKNSTIVSDSAHRFLGVANAETPVTKVERVAHPKSTTAVAKFAERTVIPPLKVDNRSIGGEYDIYPDSMVQETLLCFKVHTFEASGKEIVSMQALKRPMDYAKHKRSLGFFGMGTKIRNKLRFAIITRSTNRPLVESNAKKVVVQQTVEEEASHVGYDTMFSPDPVEGTDDASADGMNNSAASNAGLEYSHVDNADNNSHASGNRRIDTVGPKAIEEKLQESSFEPEISSFPCLVCMTIFSDGTNPDIRKLISLDQLTTIQDLQSTVLQLAFSNGDTVRLDFAEGSEDKTEGSMQKERFIWSLLQIHAMLCVSVVERNTLAAGAENRHHDRNALPPCNVRNIDKAELQYVATVNGFLKDSPSIVSLLDRQRILADEVRKVQGNAEDGEEHKEQSPEMEEMDAIAYDLMMGNFATRVAIFHSEAERMDAEEVLNASDWTKSLNNNEDTAAASAAERLGFVLQRRMRDLEAETCRRLIAWEDEKHYSSMGQSSLFSKKANRDSVDALSLASLFTTLDVLDNELRNMEDWLGERAAAIKPMTDDCRDIEEENRQLEQQWKSYDMLGAEMRRLLQGLQIQEDLDRILKNPASALIYDYHGKIDVTESAEGVEQIHEAGKALQQAIHHVKNSGGLHLKAVIERSESLEKTADSFCTALAQIIVTIMEQFKTEVVAGSDHGKVSKSDTHTMIAKKIRDTQRKFQTSLLDYVKLIEILAELSPELLPAVRDAYSEMVAEGIMMKKRMKGYFQALPGKNASYLNNVSRDLRDYVPFEIVKEDTVHAEDIRYSLTELLPLIAREAFFTAALFGLSNKAQDGREKKRNFEAAKRSVDHSTQNFNYYIQRTCGIVHDFEANTAADPSAPPKGDPMLCLIASIHLNEAMENYIDREKKGGDHSLSLAYVRATILDLRKRVDKQWVSWVEKQIEWIRSHPGVPANGKRAGVVPSFARFPQYIDHILMCCREGRKEDYTPDIANIKVVSYYLQKMATALLESLRECAERETTDQQYASNVMQMENTYYLTQCIKNRGPEIQLLFKKPMTKANATCKQTTDAYLGWMIKREFTSLHELFSKISRLRRDDGDRAVQIHVPKGMLLRTLQKECSREVLKDKIGVLYSRMGKHISEESGLLPVAWKALVKILYEWFGRWEKLSSQIYGHKLEPSAIDVVRIAKAAGQTSVAKPKP